MASPHSQAIIKPWLAELKAHHNLHDDPNYYISNPKTLITTSQPQSFTLGTGAQVLSSVLSACESTNHELILVTCFWAASSSQRQVCSLLCKLSRKALSQDRKIHVRLCFSSLSLVQKLFHTSSLDGKIYPFYEWTKLGLPAPEDLRGLDLVVKSVFVRPFSVMHPKFVMVDRERAWMPSCNVSWEEWFEGCVEMRGEIVGKLFEFWEAFWGRGGMELPPVSSSERETRRFPESSRVSGGSPTIETTTSSTSPGTMDLITQTSLGAVAVQTILLPSPHHANPHFHPLFPFPCFYSSSTPYPATPLNTFLLTVFKHAEKSIYMQTPNLTSPPILANILSSLERGIDITIITSRRLMILEQLITAGTTTEIEVWKLRRRYRRLVEHYSSGGDLEAGTGMQKPGFLRIGYFAPKKWQGEPVKSHLKLMIADGEITVLGSGNMDRASWFTSQELGVAFFSTEMAEQVRKAVHVGLEGRVEYV